MLKKRLIFTLLYSDEYFMLSRNFRLQKVGDIKWLQKNYNFSQIAFSIDELIVLDVTREKRNIEKFCEHLKMIAKECFAPISAGGGIRSISDARKLIDSGADKIVINTIYKDSPILVDEIISVFGRQCVVLSVDINTSDNNYSVMIKNGNVVASNSLRDYLGDSINNKAGELYLTSINNDGTGQGYCFKLLNELPKCFSIPLIIAGGAGNYKHLAEGLADRRVDAVATAHLFNFVGNGLQRAKESLLNEGINVVQWDAINAGNLRGYYK